MNKAVSQEDVSTLLNKKTGLNKGDLASLISEKAEISKVMSDKVLNIVLESISAALQAEKAVSIAGFGSFTAVKKPSRPGRNPKTGAEIVIPPSIQVKFKSGKNLKDTVSKALLGG